MIKHTHLTILHQLYLSETQPFRKVHRMIDLFESIIKTHTVIIVSAYVQHNKLSDSAKGLLAQGLRTPSLGSWQLFSRVLFEELQKDNYEWILNDFANEFISLDKALNIDKTNVVAFRNGYAHGATPSDAQCEADIKKFDSFLKQLMESKWLAQSSMEVQDGKVLIATSNGTLSLHPMFLFRKEASDASFAFFNDLKNDKIGLLNYPLSKHYKEKDFYTEFHDHLPLNEWKKTGNNEFYQRIEELTETFKGRTIEREKLLQFVLNNHKGYFSIQGNPGIGKSALIAQFFKDLRAHSELKKLHVVEYFIRRGTQQAQVEYMFNYLIRRTDELFSAGKEIRAEGKMVFDLQNQLFGKWRLWGEQSNGQHLLFLIDGLDEGVENNVVTYLPRENFENILIIFGSRPGGHKSIDDLWATLPLENHTKLELSGLGKEDIRALIYEVANKYELERESSWIDAVQKRSQGNPLYLKLLCDAIENGNIEINDINALPEKIDEYYKAILNRYAHDTLDGDALLNGLFTFAAAKDYLTIPHLGLINKLGSASIQRLGSTLKEVLYENPLTEEVLDYQLFHESFREYLVKEKIKEVNDAAGRIIDFCGTWQELEGSWEQRYALEHFATHLSESKKVTHLEALMDLIYNEAYASKQLKTLKSFDASNSLYQLALLKASELKKDENVLEAALRLVDLKYKEANDAPQVQAMVANGDIDLALKRIESFGGTDTEGVKRKFILYMLCLMELTLLNSKDKVHRKIAIEKLLNHLDEQIPPDTSLIEWNNFFPSYTMFLMACEWANLGLDYLVVYKRTNNWGKDWIKEKGPFSDLQFQVLMECTRGINYYSKKSSALKNISTEMAKQGKLVETASVMLEALECALFIDDNVDKSGALNEISTELAKQGKVEEATSVMQEALECAYGINNASDKSSTLREISCEFAKQGKVEEADSVMLEALECTRGIIDNYWKSNALNKISTELANQGKFDEALECTRGISDKYWKSNALNKISTLLANQRKVMEAESVMLEALECAHFISDKIDKSGALKEISTELTNQGKVEEADSVMLEAIACASGISDNYWKSNALNKISTELANQGKVGEAESVMLEALECARFISDKVNKSCALKEVSTVLSNQGKVEEADSVMLEALECVHGINANNSFLNDLSTELAKQGKVEEAIECASGISDGYWMSITMRDISTELAKQGKIDDVASVMLETLECVRGFKDNSALKNISTQLVKQGKIAEALECARGISNDSNKIRAIKNISTELAKQGKVEEAASLMLEVLECASVINDMSDKFTALEEISTELAKQGKIEEALECARGINASFKCVALKEISIELAKQGKVEDAVSVMKEALECARGVRSGSIKSRVLKDISTELSKQGKLDACASVIMEALECARGISHENTMNGALRDISTELAKQGKIEEALECARGIHNNFYKSIALKDISTELAKQGKVDDAESVMKEALECARFINHNIDKSAALKEISTELANQGSWQLAEKTGLEIPLIAERQSCWKAMASKIKAQHGFQAAFEKLQKLQNEEARLFYLKGWAENLSPLETDNTCLKEALTLLAKDKQSIENLLQSFALHEVMDGTPTKELKQRLNKSLNVQWAIDIAAKFPKVLVNARLSTNVDEWLHEIEDENDREDILGWVEKVRSGKMTEEKFENNLNKIIK